MARVVFIFSIMQLSRISGKFFCMYSIQPITMNSELRRRCKHFTSLLVLVSNYSVSSPSVQGVKYVDI